MILDAPSIWLAAPLWLLWLPKMSPWNVLRCPSKTQQNLTCIFGIFKSFPASSSKCEEYDPERIKPFQATKSKTKGTHTYKSNKNDSDWK